MRGIRYFLFLFVTLSGLAGALHALAGDTPPAPVQAARMSGSALRLGVVPFHSTLTLLRIHRPLREYLSCALGVNVMVYSANDHEQFLNSAINGHYDIVVTPAHFLPMLSEAGFVPLVRYRNPFELLLVVRKDGDVDGLADLRGHKIGLPDRLSFYYIVGMQWLSTLNLKAGTDYVLTEYSSHMAELLAVDAKQLDVAVTGRAPWLLLNPFVRDRMRPLETGHPELPSMTTMADRNLGEDMIKRIRAALESFPESSEGKRFFSATGYGGYIASTAADIDAGRVYEQRVRSLWQSRGRRDSAAREPARIEQEAMQGDAIRPCSNAAGKTTAP
jgi:phosphonate transport system substrate-binding protein